MADLNATPRGERVHIAFLGRTNAGKSSLINALTNQEVSLVSSISGTTTDPVFKSMELLPLGPVVIIDTAGLDDIGAIAELRIKKTREIMNRTDLAVVVIPADADDLSGEQQYLLELQAKNIPYLLAINDFGQGVSESFKNLHQPAVLVNALTGAGVEELKAQIAALSNLEQESSLTGDLAKPGDLVFLVAPQDIQAPKGRLILPQVQVIRDLLDKDVLVTVTKPTNLQEALAMSVKKPDLIITDSQIFAEVYQITAGQYKLTSFSVLLSRAKGDINSFVEGAKVIELLQPGDEILIAEACTHHQLEGDIARQKLPALLEKKVGGKLQFSFCSGNTFPADLGKYKLIIHCGACMINRKNMLSRIQQAKTVGVPITNFGTAIAYLSNILAKISY